MSKIKAPRFIQLNSNTNPSQYFYLVLMDLPADTTAYPSPVDIVPVLSGTELSYTTDAYELPSDYTGDTITYLLKAYSQVLEEGGSTIQTISFNAKSTKKKGDTGPVITKDLPSFPDGTPSTIYILKDRVFVLQSETNLGTYFVGGLVDYPSNVVLGTHLHAQADNTYEVERVEGTNPAVTFLAYSQDPVTYDGDSDPKTASIKSIHVNGYKETTHQGVLLSATINLFADCLTADESNYIRPL